MIDGRTVEPLIAREYVFGEYRVDVGAYKLWRRNRLIVLPPRVFDTLAVLIQHRDRAVSKEELLSSVWPGCNVTEDSITQSISTLRKALGDDTARPTLIATIARRGYRFIGPVAEASEDTLPRERTEPKKYWVPVLVGAAALAVGMTLPRAIYQPQAMRKKAPRFDCR